MKNEKRPYLKAILLTFLILLFPIISGTIIAISGLEGTSATMIQTAAFVVAFCIGALIAKKRAGSLQNIGLRLANIGDLKDYLWFLPLILIEILPFLQDSRKICPFRISQLTSCLCWRSVLQKSSISGELS